MELLKLFSANEVIAQIIGFLLLLFILRAFAWKKMLKLIDDRRERIASEFKKIEASQKEITKLQLRYEQKLSEIEETSRVKIQEAMAQGKQFSEEIREKAQQETRLMFEKSRENIASELSKAKEELKQTVIDLTIGATEKIMKERFAKEEDRKMISAFLEDLEKIK
ncbi:MAG: F0F1 ATP synthase subunit B [Candidatus Omnitrophota bacterium]